MIVFVTRKMFDRVKSELQPDFPLDFPAGDGLWAIPCTAPQGNSSASMPDLFLPLHRYNEALPCNQRVGVSFMSRLRKLARRQDAKAKAKAFGANVRHNRAVYA